MIDFIAEIGVNHLGDFDKAKRMILSAKECGATHVKFQKYNPIKVLGKDSPYLKDAHQLSWKELTLLSEFARKCGVKFGCSVFDVNDVPIVDRISDFHKIASRMNRNQEFIAKIDECKKLTYMSIQPDMSIRIPDRFKLLWCVRDYPTAISEVQKFPYSANFGLSSHCPDWKASLYAVRQGALVVENHVKEFETDLGCDMASSLSLDDYAMLIKTSEVFMGNGNDAVQIPVSEVL